MSGGIPRSVSAHALICSMGQGLASNIPYEVQEKYDCLDKKTVWSVHKGKKKVLLFYLHPLCLQKVVACFSLQADNQPVTVFVYDVKSGTDDQVGRQILYSTCMRSI